MRRIMLGLAAVAAFLTVGAMLLPEGEVVTLHALDAEGHETETQLWIVEVDGAEYVRAPNDRHRWLLRVRARPDVELSRSRHAAAPEEREHFRAVVDASPAVRDAVNAAFARKYGVADRFFGLVLDAESAVPVRLDPAPAPDGGEPEAAS